MDESAPVNSGHVRVRSGLLLHLRLFLLVLVLLPLLCFALSDEPFTPDAEDEEVTEPATFRRASHPLPFLQKKTLFLVANEPVLESHIVSNLLHQLLYTLGIPNNRVILLDEHLLSGHAKSNYANLLPWLLHVHQNLDPEIEFIWLGTAHSRVVGESLDDLLQILSKEAEEERRGNHHEEPQGTSPTWYPNGLCVGMSLRDESSAIIHHFYQDNAFVYPLIDAGLLMDRRFLDFISKTVKEEAKRQLFPPRIEIDPVHELFRFLYESRKFLMQHSDLFCPYTPIPTDFDRAETPYPPPHTRRLVKAADGSTRSSSSEASAVSGNDEEGDAGGEFQEGTSKKRRGSRRSPGLKKAEEKIKGCVSFAVGCRHSPILSHQFFDRLIEYEQDIMERKDVLAEKYPVNIDLERDSDFHKFEEALLNERPFFIVEPEDVLIAVKTHPRNLHTRVPLLKQLWASPDAVVEMAQRRSKAGKSPHAFRSAILQEEQASLEGHMRNIAIEFYSENEGTDSHEGADVQQQGHNRIQKYADGTSIVRLSVSAPGEKRALCQKLKGIFEHFLKHHQTRKFLVIVDDDTLMNVRHLLDAISMSLQAPVPARIFFRAALTNHNGLRLTHQPYKQLAEEIDKYMASWKKHHGAGEADGNWSPQRERINEEVGRTADERKADALRQKDRETAALLDAFAASAYSKKQRRRSEASQKVPSRIDRVSPLYLGQRYSFGHTAVDGSSAGDGEPGKGYDYITSGGGVVLDREAVEEVLSCKECVCPENGTADDMLLGLWMHRLKIPALHARWFHQERPMDYHPTHIKMTTPVSFHRLEKDARESKKVFDKYVDVGDGLNVGADEEDDFEALDWIDLDWEQTEDTLWNDRDDLPTGLEAGDEEGLDFPSIIKKAMAEAEEQGKKNVSAADIADHLDEQLKKQHEQEGGWKFHGHGDEL